MTAMQMQEEVLQLLTVKKSPHPFPCTVGAVVEVFHWNILITKVDADSLAATLLL